MSSEYIEFWSLWKKHGHVVQESWSLRKKTLRISSVGMFSEDVLMHFSDDGSLIEVVLEDSK